MSQEDKILQIGRSPKLISKTRFESWLWDDNYDWLFRVAKADGISMARKLNEILQKISAGKPFPVE